MQRYVREQFPGPLTATPGPSLNGDRFEQIEATLRPADSIVAAQPFLTLRFDCDGRWISFHRNGIFARRTMDGGVSVRRGRTHHTLSNLEAHNFHEQVRSLGYALREAIAQLPTNAVRCRGGDLPEFSRRLHRVEAWTPERHAAERDRFDRCYPEPVRILPPDRYGDIVVSPAVGCPNASCTFCAFYRGQAYRILEPEEFERHLRAVASLFGACEAQRSGIFLGSASAASIPQRRLLAVLDAVQKHFGCRKRGVAAFLDPDHCPGRDPRAFRRLADRGLRKLVIGLETGLPTLRRKLGKSDDLSRVLRSVEHQKAAGLECGVTVLLGDFGENTTPAHHDATVELLRQMNLDERDSIFLSPLLDTLGEKGAAAAVKTWSESLRSVSAAKVTPYAMQRFRYFA